MNAALLATAVGLSNFILSISATATIKRCGIAIEGRLDARSARGGVVGS